MKDFWVSLVHGKHVLTARCFEAENHQEALGLMRRYLELEFYLPTSLES